MKVLSGGLANWEHVSDPTAVTLGVFDGVHLGHRKLFQRAFQHEGVPTVITFDPHPIEVLAPGTTPRLLTTIDERLELFADLGVEMTVVLNLAEVRSLSPEEFVRDVLVGRLNIAAFTVGHDFQFGRDRSGNVEYLVEAAVRLGFVFDPVDLVVRDGQAISSSRIRDLVESGDVESATSLLGSPYRMTNTVVHGDKRGQQIGFPTANLRPAPGKVTPGDGVYATVARLGESVFGAATNVGTRPTFGGGERLVEAFILDFDDDIYGVDLTVEFIAKIRPELRFDGIDELVAMMTVDVAQTRNIVESVMG